MKKYIACIACILFMMSTLSLTSASAEGSDSVHYSAESFDELAIAGDGTMVSDTGNATLKFTNDQQKGDKTFSVDGNTLSIDHVAGYDPTTSTATYSDAQLVYELPEAISGKVMISMKVILTSGYTWVNQFDDWLVAKDSKGNSIMNITHVNNNLFVFAVSDEAETACQYPGCSENGHNASNMHPNNFVSDWRSFRVVFDFDEGTLYFYRNDEIASHKSTGHTYIMRLQNNAKDLKSLTFNFKGGVVATESPAVFNCKTNIDNLVVRHIVEPVWTLNKTNGDTQVDPAGGQPIITFNTVQSLSEMKKIKLYKNDSLVENPAISLSEDGKQLTFTDLLDYSTNYRIEVPNNVVEEQLSFLTPGTISFHTLHKPYGVTVGETSAYVGSSPVVGNDLSSVAGGERFTVSVACTGTVDKELIAIVALYKDGAMVNVNMANGKILSAGTAVPEVSLTLPDDTTGLTYKVFVWENYQTMRIVNP